MAISFIGQASSATTTVTLPSHQAGDLILIAAFRENATPASIPSSYTSILSSSANTMGIAVGWRLAAGSSETSGTWTNATLLMCHVYCGVNPIIPIGGNVATGGSSTTLTYGGITMTVSDGTSWVVGFGAHRSTNTSILTAPSGMTNTSRAKQSANENSDGAGFDTNGGVSSWSSQTAAVGGTTSGWRTGVIELIAGPVRTRRLLNVH
jgi:hypothetical protein